MQNRNKIKIAEDMQYIVGLDKQPIFPDFSVQDDSTILNKIKQLAHSTFDRSKFTVVGSPNITDDGIASGFSSSNYINLGGFYIPTDKSFEVQLEITATSDMINNAGENRFLGNTAYSGNANSKGVLGALYTNNGQLSGWFRVYDTSASAIAQVNASGTNNTLKATNMSVGDIFEICLGRDKANNKYYVKWRKNKSGDFTKYEATSTYDLASDAGNTLLGTIGSNNGSNLSGSIDLKQFSITVDGVEVFSGNKTGIDTIKPDAYTTTTTPPTISNDGIASNFTSSNFIKVPKEILNNVGTNSWSIEVEGVCNNYGAFAPVFSGSGHVWNDTASFFNVGRLSTANTWISYIILDNNGTKENTLIGASGTLQASIAGQAYKLILGYDSVTKKYYSNTEFADGTKVEKEVQSNLYLAQQTDDLYIGYNYGDYKLDLNTLKIYVAGDLKLQGCLKIPYTEGKNNNKIVDKLYRDRVKDLFEQKGYNGYYTIGEDDFTLPSNKWSDVIEHKENGLTVAEQRVDQTLTIRGACEQGVDVNLPMEFFSADSYAVFGVGTTGTNTASKFTPAADGNYIAIGKGKV